MEFVEVYKQTEIDWTRAVHSYENNPHSQANLDKNRTKLTGQVAIVQTLLGQGAKLTADFARESFSIHHLARRIGDCGEKHSIDIDREWLLENGEKKDVLVYFLPENREAFIKKGWIVDRPRWWYSALYSPFEVIKKLKKTDQ